ncbi:MAG: hypothetical protein J6386_21060 [Candidatus Synoicihabitans palmerolidicus]|nr:hypothetical protein [Candidatus Synoicihabitans palmerolidicus]
MPPPAVSLEIIDDTALYAALEGRSYLITENPDGGQTVIFLDETPPAARQTKS